MRVFIAGVNASMAQPFLALLEQDPDVSEIRGLDLRPPARTVAGLTFHRGDIRDPGLYELMAGCEVLVNFAFVVAEGRDRAETDDINRNGSINVYECAARAGVRKIVCLSSITAYGIRPDLPVPVDEDCPLLGNDRDEFYYSWAKQEVEEFLDGFAGRHPDRIVTRLRPGVVVGPQANALLDRVLALPLLPVLAGRDDPLSFVHERDMARAIHLSVIRDLPGAFNIAADRPLTLRELARILGKRPLPIPWLLACKVSDAAFALGLNLFPGSSRSLKLFEFPLVASNRKAGRVLGWRPEYTAEEALREMVASRKTKKEGSHA